MGRRRRVDHQRLRVAHVREVTCQPERVDDFGAYRRVLAALHPKVQHAAECVGPEHLERQLVRGVRLEAGVGDPGDLLVLLEVPRERERVVAVALCAEREGLEAHQEEERWEGVERGSEIAQDLHAQLGREREVAERVRKLEPVVALGGSGEGREAPGGPVKLS